MEDLENPGLDRIAVLSVRLPRQAFDMRRIFPAAPAFDESVPFEDDDGRVDLHVVSKAKRFGDFAGRYFDRLAVRRQVPYFFVERLDQVPRRVGAFDEKLLRAGVGVVEQEKPAAGISVAPGPADFLIVALD